MTKKSKRILIAEDDPFIGQITQKNLEAEGYTVDRVLNGTEALQKINSNEYALILLDLIMPVKDGFDVLNEMKETKNKTPVLVFSNLAQEEDKKEVMSLGAKDYYVKSNMTMSTLSKIINKYLS